MRSFFLNKEWGQGTEIPAAIGAICRIDAKYSKDMGMSENVGYTPNEIPIFHRDNDQQNHWV